MRSIILAAVVASLLNSVGAAAQFGRHAPQLIGVGDRVRVGIRKDTSRGPFGPTAQRLRGTVHAIAPETLYLDLSAVAGTVPIPRATISGVELSMGTPSRVVSALDVGSGGALLGGLFLPSFIPHSERKFGSSARAAVASAGIGFAVAALVGAVLPYERWRPAWIPE